jgi:hypothetical protein
VLILTLFDASLSGGIGVLPYYAAANSAHQAM